ncbi:MAG: stressosome-associated protein Prli42 [Acidimicrobiia bacterium]
MQNKRFVKIVIWVVVIGMVLSLALAAISMF